MSRLAPSTAARALQLVAPLRNVTNIVLRNPGSRIMLPALKALLALLLLLQIKSWPFVWHWRVFKPVLAIHSRLLLLRLSHFYKPAAVRKRETEEFLEGLCKIGENPLQHTVSYFTSAGLDDCDYNLHLSNSSYAKVFDYGRMRKALALGPTFLRAGGWLAVAGTHFHFHKEIPLFANYECRVSVMSWDNKWIYTVARFVTPAKKDAPKRKTHGPHLEIPSADAQPDTALHASPLPSGATSPNPTPETVAAQMLLQREEPDGATVHCLAVAEVVAKIGRITVPPGLLLAADGFCHAIPETGGKYSRENPPPYWQTVRRLRGELLTDEDRAEMRARGESPGRKFKAYRDLLKGGWRDVPPEERWWDQAMGREVEEQRLRGLACMQALRTAMAQARTV